MKLFINDVARDVPDDWADRPLLTVLRDEFGLVGAKFGCGLGQCGACSVLVDGMPIRGCVTTVGDVAEQAILTIEGLGDDPVGARVIEAWIEGAVAQCGYCQAGQIIGAVGLLKRNPSPSRAEIEDAMDGNLCRCGTYARIRKGIQRAAGAAS